MFLLKYINFKSLKDGYPNQINRQKQKIRSPDFGFVGYFFFLAFLF